MEIVIVINREEKMAYVSTELPKFMRKAVKAGWKLKEEFKGDDGKVRRWTYEVPMKAVGIRFKNLAAPKVKRIGNPNFRKGKKASTTSPVSPSTPEIPSLPVQE